MPARTLRIEVDGVGELPLPLRAPVTRKLIPDFSAMRVQPNVLLAEGYSSIASSRSLTSPKSEFSRSMPRSQQ